MQENPWHIRRLTFSRQRAFADLELLQALTRLSRDSEETNEEEAGLWQRPDLEWEAWFPEEVARKERVRLFKIFERNLKHVNEQKLRDFHQAGHLYAVTHFSTAENAGDAMESLFRTSPVRGFNGSEIPVAFIEESRAFQVRWRWVRAEFSHSGAVLYLLRWVDGYLNGLGFEAFSEHEEVKRGGIIVHTRWIHN